MDRLSVAVVGAGVVGVCSALWLQRSGHQVTLLDRDEPGTGASYGNACTIADYGCIPVNSPSLPKQLPSLLWSANSPLRLDPGYVLRHPVWMLQFLRNCSRQRVDRIIEALGSILAGTGHGLDPLIKDCSAGHLFKRNGCAYIYSTQEAFKSGLPAHEKRAEQGATFEILDANKIKQLEPGLTLDAKGGVLFNDARHVISPKSLVDQFFNHFIRTGGTFRRSGVSDVQTGCRIVFEGGENLTADRVVIAAGAHSCRIRGAGLEDLPLDTERGYHVQYTGQQALLQRPIAWAEAGFYATPTSHGLRLAGTVEIAGLDKPPTEARLEFLRRCARQMFSLGETEEQTWLGFRPTFPDALPVIGHSTMSRDILLAFGHQHIGLTLAGITGRLISELVDGQSTSIDVSPFSSARFGNGVHHQQETG